MVQDHSMRVGSQELAFSWFLSRAIVGLMAVPAESCRSFFFGDLPSGKLT